MKNKEKYFDKILELFTNLCYGTCDFRKDHVLKLESCAAVDCAECYRRTKDWLEQEYQEPIELTKFEYDLLDTNDQNHKRKVGSFQTYNHMRKRGYFKNVPFDESIEYVLANCEVKDEK